MIQSRADFALVLEHTVEQTEALSEASAFPVFELVRKQLDFMRQSTADGAEPSEADRQRTDLGPVAVRNFDDSYPDYATLLKALDYAFRRYDRLP